MAMTTTSVYTKLKQVSAVQCHHCNLFNISNNPAFGLFIKNNLKAKNKQTKKAKWNLVCSFLQFIFCFFVGVIKLI